MHPLPSEPIRGAAPLHSTGPSLGAWAPQGFQQQIPAPVMAAAATTVTTSSPALQTAGPSLAPHAPLDTTRQSQRKQPAQTRQPSQNTPAADVDPSQSALWADLAAELRSAPISAPVGYHAEAADQLRSAAASDLPASASGSHQAANWDQPAKGDISAGQAAAAAGERVKAVGKDEAPAAKPKPPRLTRRKLISGEAASQATDSANDSNPAGAKQKKPQVKKVARAPKPRSRSKAAESALASAEQNPSTAEESEAEDAGQGDPSRQAKNAAFKGSGALGLSRRLSSRLLTPQEVNIMAKLPLPPVLERLDKVLFPPVNGMYGFLLRQHIQVSWHLYTLCCVVLEPAYVNLIVTRCKEGLFPAETQVDMVPAVHTGSTSVQAMAWPVCKVMRFGCRKTSCLSSDDKHACSPAAPVYKRDFTCRYCCGAWSLCLPQECC
jgi:hypothetical protein